MQKGGNVRAPLSIIIPTLNAESSLAACLEALMEGLPAGLIREVIVSDGGSRDRTCDIAEEAGCEIVTGPASRGAQLQRGIEVAQGDWLLILHADTILMAGWVQPVQFHLTSREAAYFRLRFSDSGFAARWVAGWANVRARLFGLPYGDQGLLLPRTLYHAVGGYPDIPLMEDVALVRALRGRLRGLPVEAVTSAARYQQAGWFRRGARNLVTLTRYFLGTPPERLAESYRK